VEDAQRAQQERAAAEAAAGEPPAGTVLSGVVESRARRFCRVYADDRTWQCSLRGKLREEGASPVAGDRVKLRVSGAGEGVVEEVLPRRTVLSRQVGTGNRARRHTYCANVDTVVIVAAAAAPPLRPALIDRLLITARYEDLAPVVCLNKIDLDPQGDAVRTMSVYRSAGYEVVLTSALTGEGVDELGRRLGGRVSVLSGHSGVGKTSLLMRLVPGFDRQTRDVTKRARGRHSTTEVSLVALPRGGHVVDTPGFREFTVWGVQPDEVGSYYPEFLPYSANCKFHNCLHRDDPGCAVREGVSQGAIAALRYESYLRILESLEDA
jgi:ribosome biogenesis GTPase